MDSLFIYIFCGWGICITGYIILNKISKYNNITYYDLSDKIIKYKKSKIRLK